MSEISGPSPESQQIQIERAKKDLAQAALKFQNILEVYQTSDAADKARLKALMDDQMAIIQASIREIKRAGMAKQGEKVSKDYQEFLKSDSTTSFDALEHDIQTLRDYNQL